MNRLWPKQGVELQEPQELLSGEVFSVGSCGDLGQVVAGVAGTFSVLRRHPDDHRPQLFLCQPDAQSHRANNRLIAMQQGAGRRRKEIPIRMALLPDPIAL